jgi:MFS family permease
LAWEVVGVRAGVRDGSASVMLGSSSSPEPGDPQRGAEQLPSTDVSQGSSRAGDPEFPVRPASLWGRGDFLKLWGGQTISLVGTQITLLALPLAAILGFKAGPFQVGLLATFQFVPFLLFGLPTGVWVDRLPRRPILVIADLARFGVMGSVPLAAALGVLRLGQLYAVAFLSGFFAVLFEVSYQSYLPSLVDRSQLLDANGKLEVSRTAAQVAGPGVGGLLVQAFTAPTAITADAASFLASAASLLLIGTREAPAASRAGEAGQRPMRAEIAEGLRYVFGHPLIRPLTICTALINLFGLMSEAVLLIFAVRTLSLTAGVIGGVLALANAGVFAGALLSARLARRLGIGPILIGATVLIGAGFALVPLASRSSAIPVLVASVLVGGFGGVIFNVNVVSLRQAIAPSDIQGRMNATVKFVAYGTIPLGSLLGGVLGSTIGLRPTLWTAAVGAFGAVLVPLLSPIRGLHSTPEPEVGEGIEAATVPLTPDLRTWPVD